MTKSTILETLPNGTKISNLYIDTHDAIYFAAYCEPCDVKWNIREAKKCPTCDKVPTYNDTKLAYPAEELNHARIKVPNPKSSPLPTD